MKLKLRILGFISALILSNLVWAAPDPALVAMFKQDFKTQYEEGRCGDNILGFLRRAEQQGLKLYNARILEITNHGFSMFGMVHAEFARASGGFNPQAEQDGFRNLPGERNWYHHVVLESDGYIYDFDFGNRPQVLEVKNYFEKMFFEDKRKSEGGEFYVGREEKLKTYEILIRPGLETLEARQERRSSPELGKFKLETYLKDF